MKETDDRNFVRRAFLALLVAGFFALFVYALKFFMLVFAGILLGVFFSSMAGFISSRTPIGRKLALFISIFFVLGSLVAAFWFLAPTIYHQADDVARAVKLSVDDISKMLERFNLGDRMMQSLDMAEDNIMQPESYWSRFKGFFSTTLGVLADVLIILITGIFLAADPEMYIGGFLKLFRPVNRPRVLEILEICYKTLRLWLMGKFAGMAILGILFYTGLKILGVPLAFALALISALLAFIPNIGGYLGGIISVLVAFTQGLHMALYVLILYVAIQFLEDYFLTPVINKRMVKLPPALTLFWLVLLGISGGIIGLFMAAPLLCVVIILINEIYVKDHLEKQDKGQNNTIPPLIND